MNSYQLSVTVKFYVVWRPLNEPIRSKNFNWMIIFRNSLRKRLCDTWCYCSCTRICSPFHCWLLRRLKREKDLLHWSCNWRQNKNDNKNDPPRRAIKRETGVSELTLCVTTTWVLILDTKKGEDDDEISNYSITPPFEEETLSSKGNPTMAKSPTKIYQGIVRTLYCSLLPYSIKHLL